MTTKTTITLSPIKRCHGSPTLKKRRLSSVSTPRKHPIHSPRLPDLVHDIVAEQQRRQAIVHIASTLRTVGDQLDDRLQINNTSSSPSLIDRVFEQRTMTIAHRLCSLLHCFL